ncbi:MAG: 30S ribosomal protein S9 [Roseiflexus sp.]|nr:30S ribosomal protein S9 [Roseiflexus sp.]MCS7291154.1 30S ribosomal protein S9 [Roseiflexus sp.]MDW8147782.1 30S ribosomal protein S9 [Roseiflexaceae bacterium]MDW8232439.1 30S ribosomal protein S9 [Roseiflexaceae bacterium]
MIEKRYFQGTGRRKTAVARVRLFPGSGNIIVNGKSIREYFGARELYAREIARPLELTGTANMYDVLVKVRGGGISGQAQAVRHGITRALLDANPDFRPTLKQAGLITRDPRMKERKKAGFKRARKRPQYTKR